MSLKALRLDGNLQRGKVVRVQIDGESVTAYEGETVATALMAAGRRTFGHTPNGQPRGVFCGIGLCYDCLVTIDGINNLRACVTPVREGMQVCTAPASFESRG
jgi:predicted molibdopterin-dependent oxidoreductase YjgC